MAGPPPPCPARRAVAGPGLAAALRGGAGATGAAGRHARGLITTSPGACRRAPPPANQGAPGGAGDPARGRGAAPSTGRDPTEPPPGTVSHRPAPSLTAHYCPAPSCTAPHRPAPPATAPHRPSPPRTASHRPAQPRTARYCPTPPGTAPHRASPPGTVPHSPLLLRPARHRSAPPGTVPPRPAPPRPLPTTAPHVGRGAPVHVGTSPQESLLKCASGLLARPPSQHREASPLRVLPPALLPLPRECRSPPPAEPLSQRAYRESMARVFRGLRTEGNSIATSKFITSALAPGRASILTSSGHVAFSLFPLPLLLSGRARSSEALLIIP